MNFSKDSEIVDFLVNSGAEVKDVLIVMKEIKELLHEMQNPYLQKGNAMDLVERIKLKSPEVLKSLTAFENQTLNAIIGIN